MGLPAAGRRGARRPGARAPDPHRARDPSRPPGPRDRRRRGRGGRRRPRGLRAPPRPHRGRRLRGRPARLDGLAGHAPRTSSPPPSASDSTRPAPRRRAIRWPSRRARRHSTPSVLEAVRAGEPHVRVVSRRRLAPPRHHRPRPGRALRRHRRAARRRGAHRAHRRSCAPSRAVAVNEWHVESPSRRRARPGADRRAGSPGSGRGDRGPLQTLDRRRAHLPRPSGQSGVGSPGQARALVVPGPAARRRSSRCAPRTGRGCSTSSGPPSPRAGISVRSAHIATYAGQTLDTFYLTGSDGLPLPPARVAQAVSLVIDTCDGLAPARRPVRTVPARPAVSLVRCSTPCPTA